MLSLNKKFYVLVIAFLVIRPDDTFINSSRLINQKNQTNPLLSQTQDTEDNVTGGGNLLSNPLYNTSGPLESNHPELQEVVSSNLSTGNAKHLNHSTSQAPNSAAVDTSEVDLPEPLEDDYLDLPEGASRSFWSVFTDIISAPFKIVKKAAEGIYYGIKDAINGSGTKAKEAVDNAVKTSVKQNSSLTIGGSHNEIELPHKILHQLAAKAMSNKTYKPTNKFGLSNLNDANHDFMTYENPALIVPPVFNSMQTQNPYANQIKDLIQRIVAQPRIHPEIIRLRPVNYTININASNNYPRSFNNNTQSFDRQAVVKELIKKDN